MHLAAVGQLAEQQLFGQRLLDPFLQQARHRTSAIELVVALVGQPGARSLVELDMYVLFCQLQLELEDELVDHPAGTATSSLGAEIAYTPISISGVTGDGSRSEEHPSELQSLKRISYAVFCWKKKKKQTLRR